MAIEAKTDRVNEFVRSIAALTKRECLIGIPADSTGRSDGGPSNAMIGYIEEFGSPAQNIPARPSLVPGVESVKDKIVGILKDAAHGAVNNPRAIDTAYTKCGLIAVAAVQAEITSGHFTPLKPATIAARKRKGFTSEKPLIVTGQFLRSFTFVIRDKS